MQKNKNLTRDQGDEIGYQGLTLNIGNKNGLLKGYANVGTPLAKIAAPAQAFDLALDRTAINRVVFNGHEPARLLPDLAGQPLVRDDQGPRVQPEGEPDAGAEARQGSGFSTPIKVNLMIGTDPVTARLGQVIQAMEKEAGFNVELKPTEFVSSLSQADAGNFETFAIGWSGRVDPDGNIYGFVPTTGTLNDAGFSNAQLDLTPQQRAQGDRPRRPGSRCTRPR